MSMWVTLNDLGYVNRGRSKHRPRNAPELYGGPYPFVQTADIKHADLYLTEYEQTYSEVGLAQSRLWPVGTLCITIAANIADTAILGCEACFPDSIIGFIPDEEKCDVRYVKYLFDTQLQTAFQQLSQGVAQDNLSKDKLLSIKFCVPDLPVQRRIADVLSAYDDLIENNRRRIAILEETARLTYRKWFSNVSEQKEWRICKVADVLDTFHRPPKVPKELYIQEGEYPCIDQGKDFVGGYTNDMNAVVDRVPAIVFGDHTRVLKYLSCPFACGADGTQLLFAKKGCLTQEYLYFALKEIDLTNYFYARHFKILKSKSILVPPYYLVEEFSNQVRDNMDMIGTLRDYNVKLASARDMLLPRLMKGESV